MEKESQLQAKAISERDAMIANANLHTEREQAQLELSNKRVKEVRPEMTHCLVIVTEPAASYKTKSESGTGF